MVATYQQVRHALGTPPTARVDAVQALILLSALRVVAADGNKADRILINVEI
ncbi:hypothetical protein OHU17_35125 [Streptomyces goshikiensis]|uniref:Uncharacterized protein n=1 Tax=Streptomyces goshikiensis TaxID=1942 RepID=A0ABZ1RVB9_9ACTN|nr:hypothetical protein [Streptomyces goshikiensis]WSY02086.1 hypothetical protein OG590_35525 [Streptomyces goshikiensis]